MTEQEAILLADCISKLYELGDKEVYDLAKQLDQVLRAATGKYSWAYILEEKI